MSVYDKELIIDGEAVRSPEQQVFKNMKDIKKLKEIIKPEYTTAEELTSSSVSVAIADTNAPEGTTEGWLITQDGLKFKITGGDETNFLLEFYCSIQGPQGEQGPSGAELEIDDTGTSATKVWSSEKVASELSQAGKKYYRHTLRLRREVTRWLSNVMLPQIITDDITPFTLQTLNQYLYSCGLIITSAVRQDQKYLGVEGTQYDKDNSTITTSYVGLGYFDTTHLRMFSGTGYADILTNDTEWVLTDDADEL